MSPTIYFLLLAISLAHAENDIALSRQRRDLVNPKILHPDTGLNIYQFLERHEYTYENHTIITEDGYILRTIRIPHGRNELPGGSATKPAVLLLHGVWSNPQDLIIKGEGNSSGLVLADNGYDVWLMCSRGTTYSVGHVKLSTRSFKFWDFSWHEIGYYDIPANIDYVTNLTGNANVSFIGHSQGGTAFVVTSAARPEYNSKITAAVLYAPVVFMEYVEVLGYPILRDLEPVIKLLRDTLRLKDLLTYNKLVLELGKIVCNKKSPLINVCIKFLGPLAGPDPSNIEKDLLTVMASNDPAGSSWKQLIHYLQVGKSNKFRQYDYGILKNKLTYGSSKPPEYNLTAAAAPIVVMFGANDYFVNVKDALRLISQLPNVVSHLVPYPLQNHIDFAFSKTVYEYTSKPTLDYLNRYNNIV